MVAIATCQIISFEPKHVSKSEVGYGEASEVKGSFTLKHDLEIWDGAEDPRPRE